MASYRLLNLFLVAGVRDHYIIFIYDVADIMEKPEDYKPPGQKNHWALHACMSQKNYSYCCYPDNIFVHTLVGQPFKNTDKV